MKIFRIIAQQIRKYFKHTDVSLEKFTTHFVLLFNPLKIYINIYV